MPATGPIRRHGAFALAALAAAGLLLVAYSNHFDNDFHFDDSHVIVDNLYVRSLHDVPRFFTDPHTFSTRPESALYRPLLTLSFALDYARAGGLVPRAFHETQFGLLVLLGILLVPLYRDLLDRSDPRAAQRWIALFAATWFCVHTANTETVNYIASRSDLVSTLAVVASFVIYIGWPGGRRTLLYVVPMLLGALAKPPAVMFAPLLVVYRLLFEERLSLGDLGRAAGRRRAWSALTGALPALFAAAVAFAVTSAMNADTLRLSDTGRFPYLATQPYVWLAYVRLFVVPVGLTADTDWEPVDDPSDPRVWIGLLFLAGLAACTVWLAGRPGLRPAAFGLVWFALALAPSSSVVPLAEVYNEHRIFFPYVGLTLTAATLGFVAFDPARRTSALARRAVATAGVVAALSVLGAHAAGTHARNRVWRDELSLWEDVARKSPQNGRGLMNYGVALMRRGLTQQALRQFERAAEIVPQYEILEINLAIAKDHLGRPDAESHFRRALEIAPGYARGRYFYAAWLVEQERAPEAVTQLERALEVSAGDLDARTLLARLLAARGDEAGLSAVLAGTLEIAPQEPVALAYRRGSDPVAASAETWQACMALTRRSADAGQWLDAAGAARRAVALAPDSAATWNDLGWARLALGFVAEAVPCFERSLEIEPGSAKPSANLALARARLARARPPDQASGGPSAGS